MASKAYVALMRRSRCLLLAYAALVFTMSPSGAGAAYSVTPIGGTASTEHRFYRDAFHFGTLIVDASRRLIFRPHPDSTEPDGWGSSWYLDPFLAGAEARGVSEPHVSAGDAGITVSASGVVARDGSRNYGSWTFSGTFAYDVGPRQVSATGTLSIRLDGSLSAPGLDLNLNKIASNYLHDVPLQGNGPGDTGDMTQAKVSYDAAGLRNFVWRPVMMPAHFPTDTSQFLKVDVAGSTNAVDVVAQGELCQIQCARKPSLVLIYESGDDPLSVGMIWNDQQGKQFHLDNVAINHLLLKFNQRSTVQTYKVSMTSLPPAPETSPVCPARYSITGMATGPLTARKLSVMVEPTQTELGTYMQIFIAGVLEPEIYFRTPDGWTRFVGTYPAYASGPIAAQTVDVFDGNLDLSGARGAQIYAGYGADVRELLAKGRCARVHTLE